MDRVQDESRTVNDSLTSAKREASGGSSSRERTTANSKDVSFQRRTCLKLIGTSAGALATPVLAGNSAAGTKYRGITFEHVVNLVEDYGADPTGGEPVDDALEAAADADTLIEVPDGEYQFSGRVLLSPAGNLGLLGKDGASPRFVAPDGHNEDLLTIYDLPKALFENIDIDIRASDTTAGLGLNVDEKFHVQDLEYIGRGTHPDSDVKHALSLTVVNASGVGILRNVRALKGSAIGHYKGGDGRAGAYVGRGTKGTVRFEGCQFEEFGNNGLYCGRTPGDVQVVGGTYRNNNVASVRIAGDGSYVKEATVEVDLDKYTGPDTKQNTAYSTRGIVIDAGDIQQTPGALVKNCEIRFENVDSSNGAVCVQDWDETVAQELFVEDSLIAVNDDFRAIYSEGGPVNVTGTTIEGAASDGCTVHFNGDLASDSTVDFACAEQTGNNRDGVLADGADCSITDTNVNVTGDTLVEQNGGSISTSGVTTDDSCGTSNSAPTVDGLSVSEVETSDSDAEFDVDWQVSDADDNLTSVDLTLTDDSDGETEESVTLSVSGGSASGTTRLVAAGDDGSGNSYTVDLVVTDADGATDSAATSTSEGEPNSAPAVDGLSVSEVETSDSDAEFDVDWQVSDADDNLTSVDLTLTDDSDGETEESVTLSVSGGSASGTTRLVAAGDDGSGNSYTVDLVVTDADGATDSAATSTAEAEPDTAPTIDGYSVTEADSPNPHANITVDWSVSDDDGNLDTVNLWVYDSAGKIVRTETIDVSGFSASGTNEFKIKFASLECFIVELVVTDTVANTDVATESVCE